MAMVRERIGHTDHSYHHILWYDNLLIKYLHKKGMFLRVKEGGEGKFNRPVQVWGSTCGFVARSEDSQRVRSINRITPQGSHRYSRRGHDTIVLHPSHSTREFDPNKILKIIPRTKSYYMNWLHLVEYI